MRNLTIAEEFRHSLAPASTPKAGKLGTDSQISGLELDIRAKWISKLAIKSQAEEAHRRSSLTKPSKRINHWCNYNTLSNNSPSGSKELAINQGKRALWNRICKSKEKYEQSAADRRNSKAHGLSWWEKHWNPGLQGENR